MIVSNASATWNGNLRNGEGHIDSGSGKLHGSYSFPSRFEGDQSETNPEELVGAALAACFSMALSGDLERNGYQPDQVHTNANIHLEKGDNGFFIKSIDLDVQVRSNIDESELKKIAEGTSNNCPLAKALKGVEIKIVNIRTH